ncbi:MAG: hypothetical protein DMG49_21400 [Acidobacteria bacterium]|nr:MAG: hypothetical protein DMG49_21400 [Acidobacteriota bacterium]
MERQHTYSRNVKRIAVAAIGFVLAALFYKFDDATAEGCNLLNGAAWFAVEMLDPVVRTGWQSLQAYLSENSGFFQHLPQIVASIWPLLYIVAG